MTINRKSFAYRLGCRTANGKMHVCNAAGSTIDNTVQFCVDAKAGFIEQDRANRAIAPVAPRARRAAVPQGLEWGDYAPVYETF